MFAICLLTLQTVLTIELSMALTYSDKIDYVTNFADIGTGEKSTIGNNPDGAFKTKSVQKPPGLLSCLQIDDVDSGLYDDPASLPANSCTRPCVRGDTRTCYYQFYLETYVSMGSACGNCTTNNKECYNSQCVTADGYERSILTINRRMPAPSIQVCEGDKIVVDVHNMMGGRSTTIHWHGLRMKDSKFMDGVPLVTQCPIQEGSTFRYSFRADSWGMHFYHSHDGFQKVDGLVGSFLIRIPKDEDPNKDEYDYDLPSHVIVVQDWNHLTADSFFPGFINGPKNLATSYLIQGRGQYLKENDMAITNTPLAEFNVNKGKRYVFRIVAGTCYECQYIFTIESHDFVIISADGRPTQPYRVNSLTMSPGERFSVVVNANQPVDAYWMTVRSVGFCGVMNASQVAVLRYNGGSKFPSTVKPNHLESDANKVGLTMSPVNSQCTNETRDQDGPCFQDLRSVYRPSNMNITKLQPDLRIYWVWDAFVFEPSKLYQKSKYYTFIQTARNLIGNTVNGIINMHSPSPLLSQPKDVPSNLLCSADIANITTWKTTHRECIHVIKLPLNKVVEIVSIDNVTKIRADGISHPIHLHGHDMYMMEMGMLNLSISKDEAIYQLMDFLDSDKRREIPSHPVSKDTFPLTAGGYAVTRILKHNLIDDNCAVENKKVNSKTVLIEDESVGTSKSTLLASAATKKGLRLLPFLQVDDVDSGLYDDPASLPANSCTRPCVRGDTRTCYYQFNFEPYVTMGGACGKCITNNTECCNLQCVTADGYARSILTINRRMPAPSIQVCEGDKIVVDVHNMMGGRSTTIHWHGLRMKDSKFMDGVPLVTQCPIQEGSTFRYSFKADSWGMHFYHSHDGLQKVDGLVGSLVVRLPKEEDPNKDEYDYDLPSHVIVVQDWYHLTADSLFPGFKSGPEQMAATYLIQGKGQFCQENGKAIANIPLAEFNVTEGYRYVFRIVAGTCYECQYIFTIEKHDFVIIAADGRPTQPYRVNSLTMSPGERFSVVVNANRPVDAYWMTVRSVGICGNMNASQVAVLRYHGGPKLPSTVRPNHLESDANKVGLTMNPLNSFCTEETRDQDGPCLHDLRSVYSPSQGITDRQPDLRIYWIWGFYMYQPSVLYKKHKQNKFLQLPFGATGSTVNGIINMHTPSPLLSQPNDVPSDTLCSADIANITTWKTTHRECTHVIKLPVNKVIEIVSIDNFTYSAVGRSHSIHLHGYDMHMLEMGMLNMKVSKNEAIYQLMDYLESDERREIPSHPVNKDTFPLTSSGYAVSRIFTDNPGYWYFHCHFAYHLDAGMSGVLQVGDVDTFPKPPPRFPKCGNFNSDL